MQIKSAASAAPSRATFKGALRFVAIVLALAGSFQLISNGVIWAYRSAVSGGALDWLVQQKLVSAPRGLEVESEHVAQEARRAEEADARSPYARIECWRMGLLHGLASYLYDYLAAYPDDLRTDAFIRFRRQKEQEVGQLASSLAVPPPKARAARQQLYAHIEFHSSLEDDPDGTTGVLRAAYSVQHAALFRLGALVGYKQGAGGIAGKALPIFHLEITTVAPAAALPDALWRPLTEQHREIRPEQVEQHFGSLNEAIDRHLTPEQ